MTILPGLSNKQKTTGAIILLLMLIIAKPTKTLMSKISTVLSTFLPTWEGFSATPYWDVRQWSWGFGTAAGFDPKNKPAGTITRAKAMVDMLTYCANDFMELISLITRHLTANQWAALLSFSYNLGIGNAKELVELINKKDDAALQKQWERYIYVKGSISPHQVKRRAAEWQLWVK